MLNAFCLKRRVQLAVVHGKDEAVAEAAESSAIASTWIPISTALAVQHSKSAWWHSYQDGLVSFKTPIVHTLEPKVLNSAVYKTKSTCVAGVGYCFAAVSSLDLAQFVNCTMRHRQVCGVAVFAHRGTAYGKRRRVACRALVPSCCLCRRQQLSTGIDHQCT